MSVTSQGRRREDIATRRLFDLDFVSDVKLDTTVRRVLAPQPDDGRLPLVSTPNVDQLVRMSDPRHDELATALSEARIVLPDGQPIVWASRLLRRPLEARLTGSDLFPRVWRRVVEADRPALVVAPSAAVADGLRRQHPRLATVVAPYFDPGDEHAVVSLVDECRRSIEQTQPDLAFIGLGFPKQELVALGIIDALKGGDVPPPLLLLLGGSFDMYLGRIPRAPLWMRRFGLEWFYRFLREPGRLWRRYFVTDLSFIPLLASEFRRQVIR
jgi:N-acetylglucosaminyldiphosphoundecaprenol N-acetyl-beta-D-mannosaminyltransferase